MPKKLTDEELELLTEEERAGMEDPDLVDSEETIEEEEQAEKAQKPAAEEAAKPAAANPADEEHKPVEKEAKAAASEEAAKGEVQAEAAANAVETEERQPPAVPHTPVLPRYKAQDGAKDRLKEIDDEIAKLDAKFDDGELTATEYRAQERSLRQEERKLSDDILRESLSRDSSIHTWQQATVPSFLRQFPEYEAGSMRYKLLDQQVREMQATADDPFDPAILETAHRKIVAELGSAPVRATQKQEEVPRRELPPSLAHLPASDQTGTEGNPFAQIDRLEGEAYEEALARLTDEQRERYLAS